VGWREPAPSVIYFCSSSCSSGSGSGSGSGISISISISGSSSKDGSDACDALRCDVDAMQCTTDANQLSRLQTSWFLGMFLGS
jgi:hypothetical protein